MAGMKEDGKKWLLPLQSEDKCTATHRRHGWHIKPTPVGAICLQRKVIACQQAVKLGAYLFNQHI